MNYNIVAPERFQVLNIDTIGVCDEPDITRFSGSRPEHVIVYVLEGSGYYNGIKLTKNKGFIHSARTLASYYPDPNDPWTLLWFVSNDNSITFLIPYYNADPETNIFSYDFVDKLTYVLKYINERRNTVVNRAKMLELYMNVLSMHFPPQKRHSEITNERKYIDFAQNHIRTNYHLDLTVADLTKRLGIGQPYLFKIFKKYFGMSPKQYIIEYRINQAKKLLSESNLQINIIASSVGYKDSHVFSKIFSKKAGMSPVEYRALSQSDINP